MTQSILSRFVRAAAATITLSGALCADLPALQQTPQETTYTGPNGGRWNDANNWSNGVPSATKNAVIGDGKCVTIRVNKVTCRDLTVGASAALKSHQRFQTIEATGNVVVAVSAKICGRVGGTNTEPGRLTLVVTGSVTNRGTICGGHGQQGPQCFNGGALLIQAASVHNFSVMVGGDGQTYLNVPATNGCDRREVGGGRGGRLDVKTTDEFRNDGTAKGGLNKGHADERERSGAKHNGKRITFLPGSGLEGDSILMKCTHDVDLRGLPSGTFNASAIRIEGSTIDLRGIANGTVVFDAADTCFHGALLLDPGVSIESLCAGGVHVGRAVVGPHEPWIDEGFCVAEDWTQEVFSGQGWFLDNPTQLGLTDPVELPVAICRADPFGGGREHSRLYSPAMNFESTTSTDRVLLHWVGLNYPCTNTHSRVAVWPNANTRHVVWSDSVGVTEPVEHTLDITALVAGQPEAWIEFEFDGQGEGYLLVDAVEVIVGAEETGQVPHANAWLDIQGARNALGVQVDDALSGVAPAGPFYSSAFPGDAVDFRIGGAANQAAVLLVSFVAPGVLPTVFGQLDLTSPLAVGSFQTSAQGETGFALPVTPVLAGRQYGFQAVVADPVLGARFSNAVELSVR